MSTEWVRLTPDSYQRQETDTGSTVGIRSSLFEIPQSFRHCYDDRKSCYVIEFRYLDCGEPTRIVELPDEVKVVIGQRSRRIFGISVPKEQILQGAWGGIDSPLVRGLKALAPGADFQHSDNFSAAEMILSERHEAIFHAA